ncbi:hypothetical protein MTZ49_13595 [Entomomonas sp. E2T0]|uniref:hypothetical protein n=1 Tax=Entomomonas sp. E2T0 TaxID=2930213 RepID=UPI0022283741|nr:hypothetical protein [Entomomonas sp. E2T0]UYZ83614.1 hypothetical protein MTZ49_13595 [Entomomonas sp. E2T0]
MWGTLVGIAFFGLYPLLNWYASERQHTFGLYLPFELQIPFVASFIWPYFSMYLVLLIPVFVLNTTALKRLAIELIIATIIAAFIFLLIPCHLGFTRTIPEQPLYHLLYSQLFNLDHPYNLVPSLHVVYSATIVFIITANTKKYLSYLFYLWLIGLTSSTILVHQHHLLDVITGFSLSLLVHMIIGRYYEKDYCRSTGVN